LQVPKGNVFAGGPGALIVAVAAKGWQSVENAAPLASGLPCSRKSEFLKGLLKFLIRGANIQQIL